MSRPPKCSDQEIVFVLVHSPSVKQATKKLGIHRQALKDRCADGALREAYEACRERGQPRRGATQAARAAMGALY